MIDLAMRSASSYRSSCRSSSITRPERASTTLGVPVSPILYFFPSSQRSEGGRRLGHGPMLARGCDTGSGCRLPVAAKYRPRSVGTRFLVKLAGALALTVGWAGAVAGCSAGVQVSGQCQAAMAVWKGERTDVAATQTTMRCASRDEWVKAAVDGGVFGSESDARSALAAVCAGVPAPAC